MEILRPIGIVVVTQGQFEPLLKKLCKDRDAKGDFFAYGFDITRNHCEGLSQEAYEKVIKEITGPVPQKKQKLLRVAM